MQVSVSFLHSHLLRPQARVPAASGGRLVCPLLHMVLLAPGSHVTSAAGSNVAALYLILFVLFLIKPRPAWGPTSPRMVGTWIVPALV